jgi:hypothetical protein
MSRFYYTVYDPNSQALALRALEDNLITEFITNIRATDNEQRIRLLFDTVWYAINELSEYSPTDNIELLQKHVANIFIERLMELYTPNEYFVHVTSMLSNPAEIREELRDALNMRSRPFRSAQIAFFEHLLNLIRIQERIPARNLVTPYEEAMFGKCWEGYKKVGMKNKSGKRVPNCVRK